MLLRWLICLCVLNAFAAECHAQDQRSSWKSALINRKIGKIDVVEQVVAQSSVPDIPEISELKVPQVDSIVPPAERQESAITPITGTFNVKDFGAIGDGAADDTYAFISTIKAASLYGKYQARGSVHIPSGTYIVDALEINEPISLQGEGTYNTVIRLKGGVSNSLFTINTKYYPSDSSTDTSRVLFTNLTLVGNRFDQVTQNNSHGIYCPKPSWGMEKRYSSSVNLYNMMILGFTGNGIFLDHNRNWAYIDNVIVRYCNKNALVMNSYDSRISSSDFGMCGGVGIYQSSGGATAITACNIFGNKTGLLIGGTVNTYVTVSQSSFDINRENAVYIHGSKATHSITQSRFEGNSTDASGAYSDIKVVNSNTLLVDNCYFIPGAKLPSYHLELENTSPCFWGNNEFVYNKSYTRNYTNNETKLIFSGTKSTYIGPKGGADSLSIVAKDSELLRASNSSKPLLSVFAPLLIENKTPSIMLHDTDSPLDSKKWHLATDGSKLKLSILSDDESKSSTAFTINRTKEAVTSLDISTPLKFLAVSKRDLPSASVAGVGAMIFVTDEVGGSIPAFSDGTHWRRISDRKLVA